MRKIQKKKRIETGRLVLKAFAPEDRDRLVEFFLNEKINKTFMIPEYDTREEYEALADLLIRVSQPEDETHFEYGVYLGETLIGSVNDCGFNDTEMEIGYLIHPDYQGRGYATEVLQAAIEEARELGFAKVSAGYFEGNLASKRVMEKCGMKAREGVKTETYRGEERLCFTCELVFPAGT